LTSDERKQWCQVRVHPIGPSTYFSWASAETKDLFIEGYFYACISQIQSIAEGLAKFIAERNALADRLYRDDARMYQRERVPALVASRAITQACANAFLSIAGTDRNDFHHCNKQIPNDFSRLETRAQECMLALFTIESEVFAFSYGANGTINPTHRQYWQIGQNGDIPGYIKATAWG